MGRVSKAGAAAGSNRQSMQQQQQQQHSLGQPMPSLFPDDISALLRKASAGTGPTAEYEIEGERKREQEKQSEHWKKAHAKQSSSQLSLFVNPHPPSKKNNTHQPNRRGQPLRGPGGRLRAPELCDPGRGRGGGSAAGGGCGASRRRRRRRRWRRRSRREKSFDRSRSSSSKQLFCCCCCPQAPFRAALRDRRAGRRGPGGDGRPAPSLRPGGGLFRARGGGDGEGPGGG